MKIAPITFRAASDYINRLHRHHRATVGCKFCISRKDKHMSKEKQIEEMAKVLCTHASDESCHLCPDCVAKADAQKLYNAGYRKQSEGEWVDNHCSVCGMTPLGEELWENLDLTPPKFEYFMNFCPNCGAKMKGE